uniref:Uncharacterized protein n=1 Tax=Ananas comosus var. bracteatus TaxID=296719 RepID=A0A6V7NFW7_ANACO|nr:unnamed protein product [Ananas comosus var. bracteatus]
MRGVVAPPYVRAHDVSETWLRRCAPFPNSSLYDGQGAGRESRARGSTGGSGGGRGCQPVHQLDMCGESRLSQGLDDVLARRVSHRLVILGCVCDWTDEDVRALTGGVCDTPIVPHRMGKGLSLGL